jgi:hypothetical protein
MRRNAMTFTLLLIAGTARAATGGSPEVPEPVNIVVESGLDIGPCEASGKLSYPPAPQKGSPYFLLRADAKLAARHQSLTRQQPRWLHRLDGPSGTNRLFTTATGETAIVFWTCKAGDCDGNTAYGAYDPRSGRYALRVRQQGSALSLGDATPTLDLAIACAQVHDTQARGRSIEALKGIRGR